MSNTFDDLDSMFGDGAGVPASQPAPQVQTQAPPTQQVVENAPPVQAEVVQPTNTQVAQRQSTAVQGISDDFEIAMPAGLEMAMQEMGVVVGDIGTRVSKIPIDKYKASTAKVDRISFLTKKVMALKFHFIPDVGSIICFGGKCCEIGGQPQVRYIFPIAVYSTDAEGNISGKKVELKILAAGEDLYKSIMTINNGVKSMGGIDHADLLVTCTDDKYQKISLTYAGPAVWRQYAPIAQFLNERWQKDGNNAYMAVARKCDEAALLKLLGLENESDAPAQEQFNPAQSTDLSKFFED